MNYLGDALDILGGFASESIDLIVTSPPYADARKKLYGGPAPDDYVNWFMPIANELKRVLKPDGTFIINIKEKVVFGERHTYVLDLVLRMRSEGWLWTEEWIWHKKNSTPGKWPNRFRDAWEKCIQFNKNYKFKMNQDDVKIPIGDWSNKRLKNLSEKDFERDKSVTGSGFGKNVSNWVGKEMVYPTNVLHFATECGNKKHPASFPEALPEFFIKLFSNVNDMVLDPFEGSGTTGVVAKRLDRQYIGIDKSEEYHKIAMERINE